MSKAAYIAGIVLLLPVFSYSATLHFVPQSQTTDTTCTIYLSATELVNAKGLDIEIAWDEGVIECAQIAYDEGALSAFSTFYQRIDNSTGHLEIVLLKLTSGGYTGAADSFLVLTFEPISSGTTLVDIEKSWLSGDPVLIDEASNSIEVEFAGAWISVPGEEPPAVSTIKLHQNYPNPFNPNTTLRLDVPQRSPVRLTIYDVSGRLVKILIDGEEYPRGSWEVEWGGRNDKNLLVPSGVYFCLYEACGQQASRKLVILR